MRLGQQINAHILRALLRADQTVTEDFIHGVIRGGFMHVTFTEGDLGAYVTGCEGHGWIAGTNDELLGKVWALTPSGKIKAQQLG